MEAGCEGNQDKGLVVASVGHKACMAVDIVVGNEGGTVEENTPLEGRHRNSPWLAHDREKGYRES